MADLKSAFINKANKKFNFKYDYSLADYKGCFQKIKIICPIHGVFEQTPNSHLQSNTGCPLCGQEKSQSNQKRKSAEEFISQAKLAHNDKYDYSLVDYVNNYTPVKIICPIHGIFEQKPYHHLNDKRGCPICKESQGEKAIASFLIKSNYQPNKDFFRNQKFKELGELSYDFYLPKENLLIEYNGRQHYESIEKWGGEERLKKQKERDLLKADYAKKNGIKLLTISYKDYKLISQILEENLNGKEN